MRKVSRLTKLQVIYLGVAWVAGSAILIAVSRRRRTENSAYLYWFLGLLGLLALLFHFELKTSSWPEETPPKERWRSANLALTYGRSVLLFTRLMLTAH